jgi:hypothetical protein
VKTTADFLNDLRARHGLTSDSKLALHMGWQRAQLGKYRSQRETFSDATALKVAAQLGIEPGYIMACMQGQRARTPEARTAWERIAAKIAACFVFGIALTGAPAPAPAGILHNQNVPTNAPATGADYTYCTIRRRRGWASHLGAALGLSRLCRALALILALAAPSASYAADDWTGADTGRELAYLGLLAVDCSQTWRGSVEHPGQYQETNPLLGTNPSGARLAAACAGSALGHYAISLLIRESKYRELWQWLTIGVEVYAVENNINAGLKISVTF